MAALKVLVTSDGSNLSDKAVDTAIDLALQLGAQLIGVTVVLAPPPAIGIEGEDAAIKERLLTIKDKAQIKGVSCEVTAEHSSAVWKGILECALRNDVNFIVMASRGLGSFSSFLLGSETQKVLAAADRPVLVVR